jgi:hypothetical protein
MNAVRAALFLALVACTQPRSPRCKQVCARDYECVTQSSSATPFDEKECIAACSVLEADQDSAAKVQKHYDCVMSQSDCASILKKCD